MPLVFGIPGKLVAGFGTIVAAFNKIKSGQRKRAAEVSEARYVSLKQLVADRAPGASFQLPGELLEVLASFLDVKSFSNASIVNTELFGSFRDCGGSFWRENALQLFPILKETIGILPEPVDYKSLMKKQLCFRSNKEILQPLNSSFTRTLDEYLFSFDVSTSDGRSLATGVGFARDVNSRVCSENLSEAASLEIFKHRHKLTWQVTDRKTGLSAQLYVGGEEAFEEEEVMFESMKIGNMFEGPSSAPWQPASLFGEGFLTFDSISYTDDTPACDGRCCVSLVTFWNDVDGGGYESGELSDLAYLLEHRTQFS